MNARLARRWCRARVWVVPVVTLLCVTLPHLGQGDWMRTDGAWYGAIGVQAWREGSLWTLQAEPGTAYFNKPPLVLWIHGLSLHVFGLGSLQARLPTVLAAAICVVATVGIARAGIGLGMTRFGAAATGCVLALTIEFFRRTREISMDMWQGALMLLAAWLIVSGAGARSQARVVASGVPLGLALLCKPVVAIVAALLMGVWLVLVGRWRLLGGLLAAVGVACVVAVPWHAGMVIEHGEVFTSQYFGAEIAARASGEFTAASSLAKPWWFYLEQIVSSHWPWLIAAALAVVTSARGMRLSRSGWPERWAVVWSVGWLVLLTSFPDRRDRYAIPLWPGLAVLAGGWMSRWPWAWLRRAARSYLTWGWLVLAAGAVVFALLPVRVQQPVNPQWPETIAWLQRERPESLWVAGRQTGRMARIYLDTGRWPSPTHNRWNEPIASPEVGAVILYHSPDGVTPGVNERVVFESGNLVLTRLEREPWAPRWPVPGLAGSADAPRLGGPEQR